jgi:hypothetical protein
MAAEKRTQSYQRIGKTMVRELLYCLAAEKEDKEVRRKKAVDLAWSQKKTCHNQGSAIKQQ